ncbi:TPA: hypothetical protein DEP34_04820 [Candidatus Uhrbacteria bacterium]|nr:hypothetical protein [Candidatus Uhrbacteria bacterium]HCB19666.1 hypothetical protein [Candidatus Uhrbacteria bacterium]
MGGLGVRGTDPPIEWGVFGQEKPEDDGHDDREYSQEEDRDMASGEHGHGSHANHTQEHKGPRGDHGEELPLLEVPGGAENFGQRQQLLHQLLLVWVGLFGAFVVWGKSDSNE